MTDFLTRLAERVLGVAPTAQPVIPSSFNVESTRAGNNRYDPAEQLVSVPKQPTLIPSERQTTLLLRQNNLLPAARPAVPHPTGFLSLDQRVDNRSDVVIQNSIVKDIRLPEREQPRDLSSRQRQIERPPIQAAPVADESAQLVEPLKPRRAGPEVQATVKRKQHDPLTAALVSSSVRQHITPSAIKPQVGVEPGWKPPGPAKAGSRAAERGLPSPTPTIRVHIGRIEVRAVTPPTRPASRQTPPPTPAVSLDDYLRSRRGDAQ